MIRNAMIYGSGKMRVALIKLGSASVSKNGTIVTEFVWYHACVIAKYGGQSIAHLAL